MASRASPNNDAVDLEDGSQYNPNVPGASGNDAPHYDGTAAGGGTGARGAAAGEPGAWAADVLAADAVPVTAPSLAAAPAPAPARPSIWSRFTAQMKPADRGWNHWSFTKGQGACLCAFVTLLVIGAAIGIVVRTGYDHVQYNEIAIPYSRFSSKVDRKVLTTGAHWTGVDRSIHVYQATAVNYEVLGQHVSVRDGQPIELDYSFQTRIDPDRLLDLFDAFRTNYIPIIRTAAETTIRDVASQYNSDEFFDRREAIEEELEMSLRQAVDDRHLNLVGVQIRNIVLPAALNTRLSDIQFRAQEARLETANIELDQTVAENNAVIAEVNAEVDRLHDEIERTTANILLNIEQDRVRIEQTTLQLVAAEAASFNKDIEVFRQETAQRVLEFNVNETRVREQNQLEVELIVAETDARIAEFQQTTLALTLEVQRNASLAQAEAAARVAELDASRLLLVSEATAAVNARLQEAAANATRLVEGAEASARNVVQGALHDAYAASGLSPATLSHFESVQALASSSLRFVDLATPAAFADLSALLAA